MKKYRVKYNRKWTLSQESILRYGFSKPNRNWILESVLWTHLDIKEAVKMQADVRALEAGYGKDRVERALYKLNLLVRCYQYINKFRKKDSALREAKIQAILQIGFAIASLENCCYGRRFSERTFYRWKRNFQLYGLWGLLDRNTRLDMANYPPPERR